MRSLNKALDADKISDAQYIIGDIYYFGKNTEQDYKKAFNSYKLAAEQGHIEAQYSLGICYENGQGVDEDHEGAIKWYKLAADKGHAIAQNNLGICYLCGQGIKQNHVEAVKWCKLAALQGNDVAQYNLGSFYKNGQGVIQNYKEAIKWYKLAAEQGYEEAQNEINELSNLSLSTLEAGVQKSNVNIKKKKNVQGRKMRKDELDSYSNPEKWKDEKPELHDFGIAGVDFKELAAIKRKENDQIYYEIEQLKNKLESTNTAQKPSTKIDQFMGLIAIVVAITVGIFVGGHFDWEGGDLIGLFAGIITWILLIFSFGSVDEKAKEKINENNKIIEDQIDELRNKEFDYEYLFSQKMGYNSALATYHNYQTKKKKEYWKSLSGRMFEIELANLYREKGYDVKISPQGGDGGIDLILVNSDGLRIAIQCKAHNKPISPSVARDLFGTMISNNISNGILATLLGGTSGTNEFCKRNNIKIITVSDIINGKID